MPLHSFLFSLPEILDDRFFPPKPKKDIVIIFVSGILAIGIDFSEFMWFRIYWGQYYVLNFLEISNSVGIKLGFKGVVHPCFLKVVCAACFHELSSPLIFTEFLMYRVYPFEFCSLYILSRFKVIFETS